MGSPLTLRACLGALCCRSVYGKMGLWEQAVKVLTLMKGEVGPRLLCPLEDCPSVASPCPGRKQTDPASLQCRKPVGLWGRVR